MARPPPLPDERELVESARAGDRRAFERLYQAYAHVIFSYVLMPMLGDRDDAADALREAFIAAHRALPDYRWQEGGIYPWLKVLAKNKARDLLRAAGRRQRLRGAFAEHVEALVGTANDVHGEHLLREQLRAQIEAVLETLNPRYAAVLRMRLLDDRDREECARQLEVTMGNLDVLLFRACRSFRQACESRGLQLAGEL